MPDSDSEDFEVAKHAISCLNSTPLAVLSTRDKGGVWGAPVHFTHDGEFNFYAIANSKDGIAKGIKENPNVSLVIVMPPDMSDGFEVGVQIAGRASRLSAMEIRKMRSQRSMDVTGNKADFFDSGGARTVKGAEGTLVKIAPRLIAYLDKRYFGSKNRRVSINRLIQLSKYIK